jgi:hypothetical protein
MTIHGVMNKISRKVMVYKELGHAQNPSENKSDNDYIFLRLLRFLFHRGRYKHCNTLGTYNS